MTPTTTLADWLAQSKWTGFKPSQEDLNFRGDLIGFNKWGQRVVREVTVDFATLMDRWLTIEDANAGIDAGVASDGIDYLATISPECAAVVESFKLKMADPVWPKL